MKESKEKGLQVKVNRGCKGAPDSIRIATVIDVLSGMSRGAVAKKYGVDPSSISKWKIIFASRKEVKEELAMRKITSKQAQSSMSMRSEDQVHELASLKKELFDKEMELRDLQGRLDIANTMIDVAEKLFHIEIKKKLGSKS